VRRPRQPTGGRTNAAGFPRDKRVGDFDFDANPNVPAATVHQLAGCAWVKAGQPLRLIGGSGTGKTHLLIARGTAAQAGHSVRYVLAPKLVNEFVEAANDTQLSKAIARYSRVDPLLRRAWLPGTRPPRRRVAVSGAHRTRGEVSHRYRLQRAVLRLDQTFTDP